MGYAIPKSFHGVRGDIRFPTDFRATLHWNGNTKSVEIADIANGGVRLIGDYLPAIGARVRVCAKGLDEGGQVMWRTAHSCGIMLARSINALGVVRANCFPPRHPAHDRNPFPGSTPDAMRRPSH